MTKMCMCGDRPADKCDEEWGPSCDLGNNPKFVATCPEEDFDDFYDAYEVTPLGYVLAGLVVTLIVSGLGILFWLAFR